MQKNEIKIGGKYNVKISGKNVVVKVVSIGKNRGYGPGRRSTTIYNCINLDTRRAISFHSAVKFISEATDYQGLLPKINSKMIIAKSPDGGLKVDPETLKQMRDIYDGAPRSAGGRSGHSLSYPMGGQHSPSQTTDCETVELSPVAVQNVKEAVTSFAAKLKARIGEDNAPHLVIEALAGTGKTTTLIEGLKRVKGLESTLVPSPQQAAVWEAMAQSAGVANSIIFCAFNKSIATELQNRVPAGCSAMTLHSLGFRAVQEAYGRVKVESYRVENIISELLGRDIRELRRTKLAMLKATKSLVSLCKQNLVSEESEPEDGYVVANFNDNHSRALRFEDELDKLASHYDVEMNGSRREVFALVPRVLERCKDVSKDGCIDFDDMIWIPVSCDLPISKADLLLIDEAQDLNRCQQELAMRAGKRLIMCGDVNQAIYGFAGADAEALPRMKKRLQGNNSCPSHPNGGTHRFDAEGRCTVCKKPTDDSLFGKWDRGCLALPLTVTRRCGKAIVEEAKKIVPQFEAHESNGEGKVSYDTINNYASIIQDGDMVICRINAPLINQCFRFIKAGRKANIQGRNIADSLQSTIKKLNATDLVDAVGKLSDWLHAEVSKENAKRNPSETHISGLQDRYDCLICFTENAKTLDDVYANIDKIFTDDKEKPGIKLSSVHRSKGLESSTVFLLQPEGARAPASKSAWQRVQETNLLYVAITRAISHLVFVS